MSDDFQTDLEKAHDFLSNHAFAFNVISPDQMYAYGSYKSAQKAIGCRDIWLPYGVENDSGKPFVEVGHA